MLNVFGKKYYINVGNNPDLVTVFFIEKNENKILKNTNWITYVDDNGDIYIINDDKISNGWRGKKNHELYKLFGRMYNYKRMKRVIK